MTMFRIQSTYMREAGEKLFTVQDAILKALDGEDQERGELETLRAEIKLLRYMLASLVDQLVEKKALTLQEARHLADTEDIWIAVPDQETKA